MFLKDSGVYLKDLRGNLNCIYRNLLLIVKKERYLRLAENKNIGNEGNVYKLGK